MGSENFSLLDPGFRCRFTLGYLLCAHIRGLYIRNAFLRSYKVEDVSAAFIKSLL
jgi:hypothetical protein